MQTKLKPEPKSIYDDSDDRPVHQRMKEDYDPETYAAYLESIKNEDHDGIEENIGF